MLSFLLTGATYSSQEGTDLKAGRPLVESAGLIWASHGLSGKKFIICGGLHVICKHCLVDYFSNSC